MKAETVMVDSEACILSGGDLAELSDAINDMREVAVILMAQLDAKRNGMDYNPLDGYEAVGRLSRSILTIADTLNHPRGKVTQ